MITQISSFKLCESKTSNTVNRGWLDLVPKDGNANKKRFPDMLLTETHNKLRQTLSTRHDPGIEEKGQPVRRWRMNFIVKRGTVQITSQGP